MAKAGFGTKALERRIRGMPGVWKPKERLNSYIDVLDPKKGDIGLENTHNGAPFP